VRREKQDYPDLENPAKTSPKSIDTFADTAARTAFCSPNRFPILQRDKNGVLKVRSSHDYLTDVATATAKGPWNVVDADTNSTDCDASAVGPKLV
jgi:hypothetical protein